MIGKISALIRRNIGGDRDFYRLFYDMLGFTPYNIEIYKLALIHRSASYSLENGEHINNERLEYLGDAVIEAIVSDYLYIEFPERSEGFLTQMRSRIVSRQSLNRLSEQIGLNEHVFVTPAASGSQKNLGGDAFEALFGAIYLDMGYEFANRLLINEIFGKYLNLDDLILSETDFKSRLIEWTQKQRHKIEFLTVEDGSARRGVPQFSSTVLIDSLKVGHGIGTSKKEAEQNAAYSVSQERPVSDEESDELLSKIDKYTSSIVDEVQRESKPESQSEGFSSPITSESTTTQSPNN